MAQHAEHEGQNGRSGTGESAAGIELQLEPFHDRAVGRERQRYRDVLAPGSTVQPSASPDGGYAAQTRSARESRFFRSVAWPWLTAPSWLRFPDEDDRRLLSSEGRAMTETAKPGVVADTPCWVQRLSQNATDPGSIEAQWNCGFSICRNNISSR